MQVNKSISMVIYEDKDDQRELLSQLFSTNKNFELRGAFINCNLVAEQMADKLPDIVLMDIQMDGKDGLHGLLTIKSNFPEIDVIMLTGLNDDNTIFECLRAGASGYLEKGVPRLQLIEYIQIVYDGGTSFSPSIAEKIRDFFVKGFPQNQNAVQLTVREKEALTHLCDGLSKKLIADKMNIGIDGVSAHLKKIFVKLQVNCAPEAVSKAIRMRILDRDKLKLN